LATIGVFVWKFAYPPAVAQSEDFPTRSRIIELHQSEAKKDISKLNCQCTESATMGDIGANRDTLYALDDFVDYCASSTDGTLSSDTVLVDPDDSYSDVNFPCSTPYASFCYGNKRNEL
jgi:hypothetical protein